VLNPIENFWRFVQGYAASDTAALFHIEIARTICGMGLRRRLKLLRHFCYTISNSVLPDALIGKW
jgi:hypothetical protein